jgi:hypothetical protein
MTSLGAASVKQCALEHLRYAKIRLATAASDETLGKKGGMF